MVNFDSLVGILGGFIHFIHILFHFHPKSWATMDMNLTLAFFSNRWATKTPPRKTEFDAGLPSENQRNSIIQHDFRSIYFQPAMQLCNESAEDKSLTFLIDISHQW